MKSKFPKSFEKSIMAVRIVIFTLDGGKLKTLFIKTKHHWFLPGGFIQKKEEIKKTAARWLKEKTGVKGAYLEQLYTFDNQGRDPRDRLVTVAYFALVSRDVIRSPAFRDAKKEAFFSVDSLPRLAFNHKDILDYALLRLRNKIQYTNVVWSIMPPSFTFAQLQKVYEIILGRSLDKRNFRRKMLYLGILRALTGFKKGLRQRPAKLYTFKTHQYIELRRFF